MSGDKKGAQLRAAAATAVDDVVSKGRSLDVAIAAAEARISPDDRALLRMLAYGTVRQHWRLQEWVDGLLDRPLKKRDSVINALLAVGLLQLTATRIPDHAAVSQTVEAARILRRPKDAGLLYAIFRRFARERLATQAVQRSQAVHNHSRWLIDEIQKDDLYVLRL